VKAKYGKEVGDSSDLGIWAEVKNASLWWKNICRLGALNSNTEDDWCRGILVK
jgi:hypothetical protein